MQLVGFPIPAPIKKITISASSVSCVVSEQLREELRIAEREMDCLDPRTQASCLLKELEQVEG